jgi:hypothetical protein
MIDLEPIILEAQQAKRAECYAQLKPQTLIELCAELKALRAENAQLRICSGPPAMGESAGCQSRAFCYYNVRGVEISDTGSIFSVTAEGPPGMLHYKDRVSPRKP